MKMKLDTSISERDKKLLMGLGGVAVVVAIVYLAIIPLNNKISDCNSQLETLAIQEQTLKASIEANQNIEQVLAEEKAKMDGEGFLAKNLVDVDVDRVIQQVADRSGVRIISNELADAEVLPTEDFSVTKPALVYTIRDTKVAMDEAAAAQYEKDLAMERGETEVTAPAEGEAAEADADANANADANTDNNGAANNAAQTEDEKAAEEQLEAEKSIPVIESKIMIEGSTEQLIGFVDNFNKLNKSYVCRSLFITSQQKKDGSSATRGSVTIDAYFVH